MSINSTLSNEIAALLRGEILDQRYREGERLPSERDLAARFNASRGAVREALSQLEQIGLIDIQPGGARVQALQSASIAVLGPLMARNELPDPVLVQQFLQTFGALAALSARDAVQSANQEQMNRMRELVVRVSKLTKDFQAMAQQWHELLELLSEVSDNLVVQLIGNDLKAQFVEQMISLDIQPQIKKPVLDEVLGALKQCLMDKDGSRAAAAVTRYFDALSTAVTEAITARQALSARRAG
jgi:GntR family transcriptional repressor for pyruvate dehydrogenase complex